MGGLIFKALSTATATANVILIANATSAATVTASATAFVNSSAFNTNIIKKIQLCFKIIALLLDARFCLYF